MSTTSLPEVWCILWKFLELAQLQSRFFNIAIWMGCGRQGSNRKTGNKRTPPKLCTLNSPTLHLRKNSSRSLSLGTLLCPTAYQKKNWPSSSIFSTNCLLFHTALLSVRFKNTATVWMPYLSFPTYHKFFPLLLLKSVYCRVHFYQAVFLHSINWQSITDVVFSEEF